MNEKLNHTEETPQGERFIERSSWKEIEAAIRRLDGDVATLVTIGRGDESSMGIGGGKDNQYIVYATFDNRRFHNLIDPDKGDEPVYLVTGKQLGNFQARQVVALPAVLLAAKSFVNEGILNEELPWEEQ